MTEYMFQQLGIYMAGKLFFPSEVLKLLFFSKLERNKIIYLIFDILREFSKVTFRTVIIIFGKKRSFFLSFILTFFDLLGIDKSIINS